MTSKDRAEKLLKILRGEWGTHSNVFGNDIIAEIDAAVAEERRSVLAFLERRCCYGVIPSDVIGQIERGDHITPPKPRYEVRVAHFAEGKVYIVLDNETKRFVTELYHDEKSAKMRRDSLELLDQRMNKEAAK